MENNVINMIEIISNNKHYFEDLVTRLTYHSNAIEGNTGVRIDIWTHFMRECIINYVH